MRLDLTAAEPLPFIQAGQFLHLEVPDKSLILRRPFCIYDHDEFSVTTYAAIVGRGTASLAGVKPGAVLKAILPLGNGFDISKYKNIGFLGGGMGCAELYSAAKAGAAAGKNIYAYFGFASKNRVLFESDFKSVAKKTVICTDDGSYGVKGYPISELKKDIKNLDAVLICGPHGLVKSAGREFENEQIPAFVSMEQRMACGVGACLVCTCAVKEGTEIKNKRVCMDGPVFNLRDIVIG